jgi:hypothetical protein
MVFDPNLAGKSLCACGKPADTFGGQCDWCVSLQSLGLGSRASQEEIESTYRTLVKVWHPDRFPTDPKLRQAAEEKLKEINAAHDFLLSSPPVETTAPPKSHTTPPSSRPFQPESDDEESLEVEKILRSQKKSVVPSILLRVGLALGVCAFFAFLWLTMDSIFSSNPRTQRAWEEMKAEVSRELIASGLRLMPDSHKSQPLPAEPLPSAQTPDVPAAPAAPAQTSEPPKTQTPHLPGPPHLKAPQAYVTSGLTPMEVLSALGKPTSSTGEKMLYGASEIDFKDGKVAGWKIDPKAPIRVKLWPDSPPVPGLTTFGVGSSKSDVISVQGTPTLFSDTEFGYGNSFVFFQKDRVVSWKQGPSSVRLRVSH